MSERFVHRLLALLLWFSCGCGAATGPPVAVASMESRATALGSTPDSKLGAAVVGDSRVAAPRSGEGSQGERPPVASVEPPIQPESAAGQRQTSSHADSNTTIRVVADGLRSAEGQVRMSLFAKAEGFPENGERSMQWGFARMLGEQATIVFEAVPPGRYAVAVFHDEDGDGTMRKDWFGRPKEGWGVSRDAKGRFGPPSFEDAAFEAAGDTLTIHLQLCY